MPKQIIYSDKYFDDQFEYRHVHLPSEVAENLDLKKRLSEDEWRALGVVQSRGWVHYDIHRPEPHILLFRRPLAESPNPPEGAIIGASAEQMQRLQLMQQ
eukprot:TRINITY_DN2667_c0_g3_i1.p1 TRINITY_DN2667_c0_g3~~TRINITY_DN2667_c0_g3_i1.p1  ORF type:complete len:100 (-),score=26.13 TRINITY_DN2667_c0_g3_i1:36-335(-)